MSTAEDKKAEAEKAKTWPKRFEWHGVKFALRSPDDWPLEALEELERERPLAAIRLIVGEAKWTEVRTVATFGNAEELVRTILAKAGIKEPGE